MSILGLNGVYDLRTLKLCNELGIKIIGFDFNPKSFNFIQHHVFIDLAKLIDFETQKVLINISSSEDPFVQLLISEYPSIIFHFECASDSLHTFSHPFTFKFSKISDLKLLNKNNCKGVVFDEDSLLELKEKKVLGNSISNWASIAPRLFDPAIKLILKASWNNGVGAQLFEYLEFQEIIFDVNFEVEICYRNTDVSKIRNILKKHTLKRPGIYD